jgi:hypothetical protein
MLLGVYDVASNTMKSQFICINVTKVYIYKYVLEEVICYLC